MPRSVTDHFVVVADAMKEQYLAAGIGRPEQYTKIFSGFALEPFLAAKNDLELARKTRHSRPTISSSAKLRGCSSSKAMTICSPSRRNSSGRTRKLNFFLSATAHGAGDSKISRAPWLEKQFFLPALFRPPKFQIYVGIMDALVHLSLREGLPRRCRRRSPPANLWSLTIVTARAKFVSTEKPDFWFSPAILTALKNRLLQLANDPALREKLGQPAGNLSVKILPSKKWWTPFTIFI